MKENQILNRFQTFFKIFIVIIGTILFFYFSQIGVIPFPPRQFFKKSDSIARQRRKQLENYLRRLIQVCSQIDICKSLYRFNNDLSNIDKQALLEFSPFFRRGTFESSKYGTS